MMNKKVTLFEIRTDKEGIFVSMKRGGITIKGTYADDEVEANKVLNDWKSEFWGYRLN
jgi:hypothetical protein